MISNEYTANQKLPTIARNARFYEEMLAGKHLRSADFDRFIERGKTALERFVKERESLLTSDMMTERNFSKEGVTIGEAALSGKIDVIQRTDDTTLALLDYKTGKPSISWSGKDEFEKMKLHRYRQQLYFYKLLVENSSSFGRKYRVNRGGLEFVEPVSSSEELADTLWLDFDADELLRLATLIQAVWQRIMNLDLPDISGYSRDLAGIRQFEDDLIQAFTDNKQKALG